MTTLSTLRRLRFFKHWTNISDSVIRGTSTHQSRCLHQLRLSNIVSQMFPLGLLYLLLYSYMVLGHYYLRISFHPFELRRQLSPRCDNDRAISTTTCFVMAFHGYLISHILPFIEHSLAREALRYRSKTRALASLDDDSAETGQEISALDGYFIFLIYSIFFTKQRGVSMIILHRAVLHVATRRFLSCHV